MLQHYKNDAQRLAALKRSRWFITATLIIIAALAAYTGYKTFM
jgi:hypothetical protein